MSYRPKYLTPSIKDTAHGIRNTLFAIVSTSTPDASPTLHGKYEELLQRFDAWVSINNVFSEPFKTLDCRLRTAPESKRDNVLLSLKLIGDIIIEHKVSLEDDFSRYDDLIRLLDGLDRMCTNYRETFPLNPVLGKAENALRKWKEMTTRLNRLFNPVEIVDEIKRWKMPSLEDESSKIPRLAYFICNDYQIVFAILTLVGCPGKIVEFVELGIADERLPLPQMELSRQCGRAFTENSVAATTCTSGELLGFLAYQISFQGKYPKYFAKKKD